MITLRPVDSLGVYTRWDWFRRGLETAIRKTSSHFRPEDVYIRLRGGTAYAYVIQSGDADVGFAIFTQEHDPDGLVLFVYALWCDRGLGAPNKREIYAAIDKLATDCKARRVRYWSPRRGWEREAYGKPVAVIYEREMGV